MLSTGLSSKIFIATCVGRIYNAVPKGNALWGKLLMDAKGRDTSFIRNNGGKHWLLHSHNRDSHAKSIRLKVLKVRICAFGSYTKSLQEHSNVIEHRLPTAKVTLTTFLTHLSVYVVTSGKITAVSWFVLPLEGYVDSKCNGQGMVSNCIM